MADNVTFTSTSPAGPPNATVQRTDDLGVTGHVPYAKLMDGTDGASTVIAAGGGVEAGALRVTVASDSTGVVSVDDNGSTLSVDDGASSLTVDAPVGTPVFVRLSDGSAAITTLPVSAASLPLPSGASTSAKQDTAQTALDAIKTAVEILDNTVAGSEQQVDVVTSALPTGASTLAEQQTQTTSIAASAASLSVLDDWDESDRAKVNVIAGQVGIAGGTGVDGATVPRVTLATNVALPTGTNSIGQVTANAGTNLNTSTLALEAGGNLAGAATSLAVMDDWDNAASDGASVSGDVAHDTADAGEPVKIGAKAVATLSTQTLVTANDRSNIFSDLDGALIARPYCPLGDLSSGVAAITDGSSTSVIASPGAGLKTYITSVIIANSSASFVTVDIRDGAAGSVKATFPAPATGGAVHQLAVPLGFTADTAVCADPSAAASTVTVTLIGFKSKV